MPPTASLAPQALDTGAARPLPSQARGKPAAAAASRNWQRNWQRESARAYGLGLAPALVVLAAITLLPLITLVVVSLTPLSLTDPAATFHFDQPAGNYAQLLQDQRFVDSLWVQAKLSSVSVLLQLLVGLGLALLLHSTSRMVAGLRTFFLIPMVLPPIVVALVWKIIYTPDISPMHALLEQWGWPLRSLIANPDTALWAIVAADVWQWFPFTMLMVLAQLQMVPRDPVDAARIDGANRWQVFVYIVLPYLQRTLVVCALFRLIDSFKAFPLLYVLTNGGPGTVTEVTNFYGFIQAFNFSYWGYGSAIAVVMLAIIFVLSALVSRLGRAKGDAHAR
ncbi:sugar ABC transporter permease [Comamonas sp. MYb21]|uniref:carbohydrate ABC transporter permease n=1 Tax=unclassified Comamonas TaxID=2638500 RepID=UPI0003959C1B|nr:sugar ABC transporter permease [Comamonas sp. B-9]